MRVIKVQTGQDTWGIIIGDSETFILSKLKELYEISKKLWPNEKVFFRHLTEQEKKIVKKFKV